MASFILKVVAIWLKGLKYEILLADGVWRAEKHHLAKFCQNWPMNCRDITIFQFFFKLVENYHLVFGMYLDHLKEYFMIFIIW